MNIQKAELSLSILNNLGADFDDQKEAAEKQVQRFEGALTALRESSHKIEDLLPAYKKEFMGEGDEYGPEGMPEEIYKAVEKAIRRASGVCLSLHDHALSNKLRKLGGLDELTKTVESIRKRHQDQQDKLQDVLAALDNPELSDEDKASIISGRPKSAATNAADDIGKRRIEGKITKLKRLAVEIVETEDQEERDLLTQMIDGLRSQLPVDVLEVIDAEGNTEAEEVNAKTNEGDPEPHLPLFE